MHRSPISYDRIVELVEPDSTVLDLGCGSGELLQRLRSERSAHGRGVEIEESLIRECIAKGISVFQGNLDEGLQDYESQTYDYVILNQTLQVVHQPIELLREMVRVGRRVIVGFPNFAFVQNRLQLTVGGRMPKNSALPYEWYDTPNIHLCTYRDFHHLCRQEHIVVLRQICMNGRRRIPAGLRNLLAVDVYFLLAGRHTGDVNTKTADV